jgi:hypothetical protein
MKPLFASITVVMIAAGPSAAADLIPRGEAGAWKIYVDPEHANGCLTEVVFDDGTFLRLGFRDHGKKAFLSSYHPGWKAFKPELPYRIAYMIDDTLFEGEGRGCPSSDDLGHEGLIGKGGSGSLLVQSMPLSDGAASGASRWSLP